MIKCCKNCINLGEDGLMNVLCLIGNDITDLDSACDFYEENTGVVV